MRNHRPPLPAVIVFVLIVTAYLLRIVGLNTRQQPLSDITTIARSAIYIALFLAWGFSVYHRLLHPQTRRLLTTISALMVFWMTVRSTRFLIASPTLARWCWYLYYIPMLYIPLLAFFCTFFLGRAEQYRLPGWSALLPVIAGCIVLFVLTNDLHQLVFVFDGGILNEGDDYRYGWGFLLPALWQYGYLLLFFGMLVHRSRVSDKGKRILLPVFCGLLLTLYHVIYLTEVPWLRTLFGDMTVIDCLLIISILESCMRHGLLSSNTNYVNLFRMSEGGAVIVNDAYEEQIAAASYVPIPVATMRQTETAPVLTDTGLRISSAKIRGGRIIWTEDVSELQQVIAELADQREYLAEQVTMLQKDVETRKKGQRLYEQNRLFGKVIGEMQKRIALFSSLTDALERSDHPDDERILTLQLAIICTQIKRSVNLVFIEELEGSIAAGELLFAVQEWLVTLRLAGIQCDCTTNLVSAVAFSDMLRLYDLLTCVLLNAADGMKTLFLRMQEEHGMPLLTLDIGCSADLHLLSAPDMLVTEEGDGEWAITIRCQKGEENP